MRGAPLAPGQGVREQRAGQQDGHELARRHDRGKQERPERLDRVHDEQLPCGCSTQLTHNPPPVRSVFGVAPGLGTGMTLLQGRSCCTRAVAAAESVGQAIRPVDCHTSCGCWPSVTAANSANGRQSCTLQDRLQPAHRSLGWSVAAPAWQSMLEHRPGPAQCSSQRLEAAFAHPRLQLQTVPGWRPVRLGVA